MKWDPKSIPPPGFEASVNWVSLPWAWLSKAVRRAACSIVILSEDTLSRILIEDNLRWLGIEKARERGKASNVTMDSDDEEDGDDGDVKNVQVLKPAISLLSWRISSKTYLN